MIEEALESPGFYILSGVGIGAFAIMTVVLNAMGNGDLMPFWVKAVTIIAIPIIAMVFNSVFSS